MAEHSGFFNAHLVDGAYDRIYHAEDFAKYFSSLASNGVFSKKLNELMVYQDAVANMNVRVLSGYAFINGYHYENDDELLLTVDVADGILNRIDSVVVRWSTSDRAIRIAIKKGTAAANALPPPLQRDADVYELSVLIEDIMRKRCRMAYKGFNWQPNATYVQRSLYHLFKEYYKSGKLTIHKKDKDYDKIRYELEDLKRKENRELKKLRREDSDKILGYVFERRKERDRIKAAEERARDIITRDRLGFDEYSFKGETKYGEIKERK